MAAKKKSKKKATRKPSLGSVSRRYQRTRASIRRRFLEDATHYRPEVEAMRAAVEELSGDDDFWQTMESIARHTEWRPTARRAR